MGRGGGLTGLAPAQLAVPPAGAALVATLENVLLAFEPRVVMAAMQTTMMRASMTAYSTAVGPSSAFRNDTRDFVRLRIFDLVREQGYGRGATAPEGAGTVRATGDHREPRIN